MSWIVGANTFFGYGVMVSDICVTIQNPNGRPDYKDVLQKSHKVGQSMAAGFAGSIPIGLPRRPSGQPPRDRPAALRRPARVRPQGTGPARPHGPPPLEHHASSMVLLLGPR